MKKFTTWPHPPSFESHTPPPVPSTFAVFGLSFSVIDNAPVPTALGRGASYAPARVRAFITGSYALYRDIVKDIVERRDISNKVTRLRDMHLRINTYLGMCRACEVRHVQERERVAFLQNRKKVRAELDAIIDGGHKGTAD